MALDKINFSYPKGNLQSVYDTEEMTALELAAKTSKKVDECVELVNGVEQSAIEATGVVDDMRIAQEQFMTENNDIRQQLVTDNQNYVDNLNTSKTNFDNDMTTALNNTKTQLNIDLNTTKDELNTTLNNAKNNFDLTLNNYQTTANTSLTNFTTELNVTKTQVVQDAQNVIQNSSQQIKNNVDSKLELMSKDGTLTNIINQELFTDIRTDISQNELVVSTSAPTNANTWCEVVGETTIEINGEQLILQEI
jgi:ElaB/YqjD/DUF883 family membrane-anchored ribosome-binding protein